MLIGTIFAFIGTFYVISKIIRRHVLILILRQEVNFKYNINVILFLFKNLYNKAQIATVVDLSKNNIGGTIVDQSKVPLQMIP